MSVAGISSSSFFNLTNPALQSKIQQSRQEFQQLGQDLQSGNLSAAQADFATLQQLNPQAQSTTSAQSTNPIAQEFAQLSKDLQSGNLSAAQQDFFPSLQSMRRVCPRPRECNHHHKPRSGGGPRLPSRAKLGK